MTVARAALIAVFVIGSACSRRDPPGPIVKAAAASRPAEVAGPSGSAPLLASGRPPVDEAGQVLPAEEWTWTFTSPALGSIPVVVVVPARKASHRFPVLIAMHGRGEALKGPARGARGWLEDYGIRKVIGRLGDVPLNREDFLSFVTSDRLARINGALADKPYRGLVLVFPYTPDVLQGDNQFFEQAAPLADLFVQELLPRVYRETPAIGTAAATGIDGVSLGGRAAYSVGLLRPESFGAVGALQAAFDLEEIPALVPAAVAAKAKNPTLGFRMLTSRQDYFRQPNTAIARAFTDAGVRMTFDTVEGPHDYAFNRGPGAIEMLIFHDRVLRGDPPP